MVGCNVGQNGIHTGQCTQCSLRCFQGNTEAMMAEYRRLLTYIKGAVTRNYSEKSINSILDYISTSSNVRGCVRA